MSDKTDYNDLLKRMGRLDVCLSNAIKAKQFIISADDKSIIEIIDNTYEANVCAFLLMASRNELILCLSKILETGKENRCSLPQIIKIRKKLDKYISENIDGIQITMNILDIEKEYNKIIHENNRIKGFIFDIRNKHLAHVLTENQKVLNDNQTVKYKDLFGLLNSISVLFEILTRATKHGSWDNFSRNAVFKRHTELFWSSLSAGVKTNPSIN